MGFFDDIEVQAEDSADGKVKLILRGAGASGDLEDRFRGQRAHQHERSARTSIKVKEWSILDVNKVKEDVGLIQKHYEDKGFYLAKVSFEVKQTESPTKFSSSTRSTITTKSRSRSITFLNNKRFTRRRAEGTFAARPAKADSSRFVSSSGSFKESAFKTDLQRLTYWYLDHGYVKFRYENPVVTVSDDKKWLYISIYVDEGEQYSMGTIDFSGDLLFTKDELHTI